MVSNTSTTLAGAPARCSDHDELVAMASRIRCRAAAMNRLIQEDDPGRAYLQLLNLEDELDQAKYVLSAQYSEHVIDALLPETAKAASPSSCVRKSGEMAQPGCASVPETATVAMTCTQAEVDAYERRLRDTPFNPQSKIGNPK